MSDQSSGETRRRGIQSVEIGLRVLEALAVLGGPAPLSAIAQATDMPPPQAHRYLQSLIAAGMAQQHADSGRYDLGPAALKLGLSALARVDAFQIADTAITDFVRRTNLTVQLAALGPLGPTIVRWLMGRPPVMTSFNVGSVLPLLTSATGQVFFSFMPDAETGHLVARELAEGPVSRSDADSLRAKVRADGFAYVDGMMVPGLRATAFPIFDLQGRVALTATALQPDLSHSRRQDGTKAELATLCRDISRQLGWQG